jgi:hypothetical protein
VLDLRTFDKNKIYGYDSPKHNPKKIDFDISKEKIDRKITVANT